MKRMRPLRGMMAWALVAALLAALPFVVERLGLPGTDDGAIALVGELNPGYRAWLSPLFKPSDSLLASAIFSCQALVGLAAIIFFVKRIRARAGDRDPSTRK